MTDITSVIEALCSISGLTEDDAVKYSVIINNCAGVVESTLTDSRYLSDDRIIFLIAARAYYYITLSGTGAGNVSEFQAGDVSVKLNSQSSDSALELYRQAANAACGMINDNGFVFRGV